MDRGPDRTAKGVTMKNIATKVGIVAGSALLGMTLLSAPSQADSSWGCGGCRIVHPHR